MPHHIIRLSNGLRLIHKETDSPISHFGVLVNAGTRDESAGQMGMAHFVEHTIFKGTEKRSAYRVISRMEDVGGDLNASTSKEETCFHASFLSAFYPRAVELLADIAFHATFPEKELEKEKTVVLEEINFYKDSPSELIFDDFEDLVFAGHPLGKNILGTPASVRGLHRQDILDFIRNNYTIDNIVLASVGNISTKRLVRLCERYFGGESTPRSQRERLPFTTFAPQHRSVTKKIIQSHVMTGGVAYPITDDKRDALSLLNNLLGGQGMSSRLNMRVREKNGLAYAVESSYTAFSDTGLFTIYFGCEQEHTNQCMDLILKELKKLREQKLGTMQLFYAKKQFIGQWALSYETELNEMLALGHTALFFDEVDTFQEAIADFEALTADNLLEVANEILLPDNFSTLVFEPRHGK
ncbi:MAG: insulinase family protein [Bacteroidales bacterium]|nr:insulinase family protein [Bacteroidales bacterium]